MKLILYWAFILLAFPTLGQTTYTGFIDKYPIELATLIYSDDDVQATYVYTNQDTPILRSGKVSKGTLTLFEKDAAGKNSAVFSFPNFNGKATKLNGTWTNLSNKKQLLVKLDKNYTLDHEPSTPWKDRELIQTVSLKDHYFKLVLKKEKDDYEPRVKAVRIIEKKTDRIVKTIEVDCQLWGLGNISTGDFNFDGIEDFSVFESSYAGANTSSLYFLYDSATRSYIDSKFTGTSLEFDPKSKTISETNQCCAGRQYTTAKYKVVNNRMVMIEQHCYIWDEKKEDLVERKMKDCQ